MQVKIEGLVFRCTERKEIVRNNPFFDRRLNYCIKHNRIEITVFCLEICSIGSHFLHKFDTSFGVAVTYSLKITSLSNPYTYFILKSLSAYNNIMQPVEDTHLLKRKWYNREYHSARDQRVIFVLTVLGGTKKGGIYVSFLELVSIVLQKRLLAQQRTNALAMKAVQITKINTRSWIIWLRCIADVFMRE